MNIVYSAVFAGRDGFREPKITNDCKYILFTDDPKIKSDVWDVRLTELTESPRRMARKIKLLPHVFLPDHDMSLWIDGSMQQVESFGFCDIELGLYKHRYLNSVHEIMERCLKNKWDWESKIKSHYPKYENFPKHTVYETAIVMRKNSEKVREFNELWWKELNEGSERDQISLPYVLHKTQIKPTILGGDVTKSGFFEYISHPPTKAFEIPYL